MPPEVIIPSKARSKPEFRNNATRDEGRERERDGVRERERDGVAPVRPAVVGRGPAKELNRPANGRAAPQPMRPPPPQASNGAAHMPMQLSPAGTPVLVVPSAS